MTGCWKLYNIKYIWIQVCISLMSLDIRSHQTAVECIHFIFNFIPPHLFQWSNLLPTSHHFLLLSLIFGSISQSVPIFDVVEWTHRQHTQKITQSIIKTSSPDSVAVFFLFLLWLHFFFLGRSMDGWINVEMHQIFYILKVFEHEAKNMLKTKNYGLPFGNKKTKELKFE